ncbi:MAG TPA: hypothetical protein VH062_10005 [Polyangiaceae bacterium]|jgi:hypothetical protein|nr:hypothetical protein [Polyangiaceae bacterium]
MAHRSFVFGPLRLAVAIAVATAATNAVGMPASPASPASPGNSPNGGVVVAETAVCRVVLTAVSYDDPGADDAEFVELHVEGLEPDSSCATMARHVAMAEHDAGCDAAAVAPDSGDAGSDARAGCAPTLGDCGLDGLVLVDGANGACSEYRVLPLATVVIPGDGYVVLCPAGSSVDQSAHCDVTSAGRSALRAGWLQNGPNDGLRFTSTHGANVDIGYEGSPACFEVHGPELATESGESGGDATLDDVNVVCDGSFVVLPSNTVPLRAPVTCPRGGEGIAALADAGAPDATPRDAGQRDANAADAPWQPEHAPAPASRSVPPAYGPLYVDAGPIPQPRTQTSLPRPPGCAVATPSSPSNAASVPALLVLALVLRCVRRERRVRREQR